MYHNPRYKYRVFTLHYKSNLKDDSVTSIFKEMSAILQDSPPGKLKQLRNIFQTNRCLKEIKRRRRRIPLWQKTRTMSNALESIKGYLWNLQPCCSLTSTASKNVLHVSKQGNMLQICQ